MSGFVKIKMDSNVRSLTKAVSWRVLGSLMTLLLAYVITHDIVLSGLVTVSEFIYKIILYWLHERVWENIEWGKENV